MTVISSTSGFADSTKVGDGFVNMFISQFLSGHDWLWLHGVHFGNYSVWMFDNNDACKFCSLINSNTLPIFAQRVNFTPCYGVYGGVIIPGLRIVGANQRMKDTIITKFYPGVWGYFNLHTIRWTLYLSLGLHLRCISPFFRFVVHLKWTL